MLVQPLPSEIRGGIFKLLRSPGIDSKESISPAYVSRSVSLESILGLIKSLILQIKNNFMFFTLIASFQTHLSFKWKRQEMQS
jgi:hypothetical protein